MRIGTRLDTDPKDLDGIGDFLSCEKAVAKTDPLRRCRSDRSWDDWISNRGIGGWLQLHLAFQNYRKALHLDPKTRTQSSDRQNRVYRFLPDGVVYAQTERNR